MHKSEKLGSEMLRQAQHDKKEPFCHSEEQRDEESRGCARVSLKSSSYSGSHFFKLEQL